MPGIALVKVNKCRGGTGSGLGLKAQFKARTQDHWINLSLLFKFFTNPYRLKAQYLMGLSRLKPKVNWPEELKAQKREGSKAQSSKTLGFKAQLY